MCIRDRLNTYSDHRTMNLAIKARFEEEIKEAILEHNNLLKVYDTKICFELCYFFKL